MKGTRRDSHGRSVLMSLFLGAVGLLAACGDDESFITHIEVVDSAGIRIVTHSPPLATWRILGEASLLRLGEDSPDATSFYRVRGGVLTDAREIVIGNGGHHEVLYFSDHGELIRSVGRKG